MSSVWFCQGIAESSLLHDPCLSEWLGKPKSPSNHPPTPKTEGVPGGVSSNLPSCNISSEVNSVRKGEYTIYMASLYQRGKHGEVLIITLELEEFLVVGKAINKREPMVCLL